MSIVDNFIAPKCMAAIGILVENEDFLIINKPSGLLSLSGKHPLNKDSVHFRLVQDYPSATMAHRLDFGTSGIMLVALNKTTNANFTKQFQAHSITKTYMSMLDGHVINDNGLIDIAIAKDPSIFPRVKTCNAKGKLARTSYKVIKRYNDSATTKVKFSPESGRTHQLRIHSQYIGHPILGCDLYGTIQSQRKAKRLMLHADTLSFDHPKSNKRIVYECPSDF